MPIYHCHYPGVVSLSQVVRVLQTTTGMPEESVLDLVANVIAQSACHRFANT